MRRLVLLVTVLLGVAAVEVAAQTVERPFEDFERYVDQGDRVFVTARKAGEIEGTVHELTTQVLTIETSGGRQTFSPSDVGWLERFPDPIWDEVLVGAATGYAATLGSAYFYCGAIGTKSECTGFLTSDVAQRHALSWAGIFAATGFLVDVARRRNAGSCMARVPVRRVSSCGSPLQCRRSKTSGAV